MSGSADELPATWIKVSLSDVCTKITDGTHRSPSQEAQSESGEFRYITAKNIKEHGVDLSDVSYVSEETHRPIYRRCNPEFGDVLYIKDGVTTGIATVNRLREEFSLLSSVALLKPARKIVEPRFLKWFLNGPGYDAMTSMMGGTAIKRLTLTKIKAAPMTLAPLPEQRRIVAKIEELFSELDAGTAALEKAQARLERYRGSVLQAAVEGRLTEQWREENPPQETGEELLERILVERRKKWEEEYRAKYEAKGKKPPKGWKERYKEPEGPDTSELPELAEGWCWATVDQIAETANGGTPSRKESSYFGGEIPWVKSGELGDSVVSDCQETISKKGLAASSAKIFPAGTLCVALYGATVGKVGLLGMDAATNQAVCGILLLPSVSARYAFHFFRSIRRELVAKGQGGAQPNISQGIIRDTLVPIPPPAEQTEIVARVEKMLSLVEATDALLEAMFSRSSRTRQAILKRGFEGGLVPQDPVDEPASVLLERIRAERQGKGSKKKRRSEKPDTEQQAPEL